MPKKKKNNSRYQAEKKLGELYRQESDNISFSDFKKKLGIKQGRPKKDNNTKII